MSYFFSKKFLIPTPLMCDILWLKSTYFGKCSHDFNKKLSGIIDDLINEVVDRYFKAHYFKACMKISSKFESCF